MSNHFRAPMWAVTIILIFVLVAPGKCLASSQSPSSAIPDLTQNKDYMETFDPPVWYDILASGEIRTLINNKGQFGSGYISGPVCDGQECPSFETPENSGLEYLFAGALWLGGVVGSDTLVSTGVDGWFAIYEFWPDKPGSFFDGVADISTRVQYADTITDFQLTGFDPIDNRPHIPLNLRVADRAYAWTTDPENNLIIHDMVITNIGGSLIENGYVGYFIDGDVYHISDQATGFFDDLAGALRDENIAYIIDNNGDPKYNVFDSTSPTRALAFKFLDVSFAPVDTNFNWWISNGNASLDFGPRLAGTPEDPFREFNAHLGTPTGDRNKYYILSHKEFDYDQCATMLSHEAEGFLPPPSPPAMAIDFSDGYDARFLMSIGPFDLAPDSSIRVIFTTFTGDNVHHVVDNIDNLAAGDPEAYLANLDFSDVLANAAAADILVPTLLNYNLPPTGLQTIFDCDDSVVVEWDPYGHDGIDGYGVYLYTIPLDSLPYPDVVPPWLHLGDLSVMQLVADNGMAFRYTFDTLQPGWFYYVSVNNRAVEDYGALCDPLLIRPGGRIPAPVPEDRYLFIEEGDLAPIRWTAPGNVDIDHFNIYRLAMDDTIPGLYYPFYDTGEFAATAAPVDSFFRDGQWFYYYAMEPYAQNDSGITGISDYTFDSTYYYITAVDKDGHESDFSEPVGVYIVAPYTARDILVINCQRGTIQVDRAECDSLNYFYDYILGGEYDRYDMPETLAVYGYTLKPDLWRDMIPYRLVIVDGGLAGGIITDNIFSSTADDFEKYILSGGKFACFATLSGLLSANSSSAGEFYSTSGLNFISDYLGIDSLFMIGLAYYDIPATSPDTLAALIGAIPVEAGLPYIGYNPLVNGLGAISPIWPEGTAPTPNAFKLNAEGTPLYTAETMYPSSSMIDNEVIGVKTEVAGTATYLFGFHLWYMDPDSAYSLVQYLLNDEVSNPFVCGDANGDGQADIGDAVYLINYIFRSGPEPYDPIASDPNGDGEIDVGDIVFMVNFIFRNGEPPHCP